jgi:hypothetical protein
VAGEGRLRARPEGLRAQPHHALPRQGAAALPRGPATTDARATTQYGRTTISANEALGQTGAQHHLEHGRTTYPGTTVTMTSGDIIGIELNDGTIHWTTISGLRRQP